MNTGARTKRSGMTLLEVLVVTSLVAVMFNITASMFVLSGRITAMSTIAVDRLDGVLEAQAAFTEAVRAATGVADTAAGFTTSVDRMVLRTASGITVFGRLGESDRIGIIRLEKRDGEWISDYVRPLRQRYGRIAFRVVDDRLAEMDLVTARDPDERRGQPMRYRVRAAWRGIAAEEMP